MSELKSWFKENQAVAIALITQALIFGGYIVSLEGRTSILETRGSPHLTVIDNRLAILESKTENTRAVNGLIDLADIGNQNERAPDFDPTGANLINAL